VVAGASGGQVGVAGTFTVTLLKTHTFACVGAWTDDGHGCNNPAVGVTIVAGNNVLISASDATRLMQITASLAGGYVGVGVAVGVAKVDKDTQSFIGQNSHVDAKPRAVRRSSACTTGVSRRTASVRTRPSRSQRSTTVLRSSPRRSRTSSVSRRAQAVGSSVSLAASV
jgi:hypothetical protein